MNSSDAVGVGVAAMLVPMLIMIPIMVFMIVSGWKMVAKAGQPGWSILIPIYNYYIMLKIAGKPGWWLILMFIPVVNFVIAILVTLEIAKAFGKSTGFGVLMLLLPIIAIPILAFGDAKYTAPPAAA